MIPMHGTWGATAAGGSRRLGAVAVLLAGSWCGGERLRAADLAVALADPAPTTAADASATSDPLAGAPWIDPATTGPDAERILADLVPPRSDAPGDWVAPLEPLHDCGEPRWLPPCVPPPPCHPASPPQPSDLVGVHGLPTCGPRYAGPCAPRTGTHDDGRFPWLHRVSDRLFDRFYRSR